MTRFEEYMGSLLIEKALRIKGDLTVLGDFTFGNASTDALTVNGLLTLAGDVASSQLEITGTWGLGLSDAAVYIGGSAAIAFGEVADSVVVKRTNITVQLGVAEKYVIGEYKNYTTSGAGAGTVLQHGIWMGDYTGLTIAHDTTDAYANRGRTAITDDIEGNQFIGVMGQIDISGIATLEATGGAYAIYGSVTTSGTGASNRNVAAGYFTMRTNAINLAGEQSCVVADMGGSGYADYGFKAHVGNNNVGQAAIGIEVSDSAVLASGIKFSVDTAGSITHAFEFDAANTAATPESAVTFAGDGIKIAVDYNGTTYYLRAASAFS